MANAWVVSWGGFKRDDKFEQGSAVAPCSGRDDEWRCTGFIEY